MKWLIVLNSYYDCCGVKEWNVGLGRESRIQKNKKKVHFYRFWCNVQYITWNEYITVMFEKVTKKSKKFEIALKVLFQTL